MAESFDFRSRYITVFKIAVFLAIVLGVAWGVGKIAVSLQKRSQLIVCHKRLQGIGIAMMQFRDGHSNQLPRWLTELYPQYVGELSEFICRKNGQVCFPEWMKKDPAWRKELDFANLDGTSLDPTKDKDTIPCSYFYRFNHYPVDVSDPWSELWSQRGESDLRKYKDRAPVAQCYWHLEPEDLDDGGKVPSLLDDMATVVDYPRKWRTRFGN